MPVVFAVVALQQPLLVLLFLQMWWSNTPTVVTGFSSFRRRTWVRFGGQAHSSPFSYSTTTTIRSSTPTWNVGETALLSSNQTRVTIQEIRGKGWYRVATNDLSETFLVRSNQLLFQPNDNNKNNNNIIMNNNNNNNQDDSVLSQQQIPPPPPPTMMDFDQLLQQAKDDPTITTTNTTNIPQLEYIQQHYHRWIVFTDLHCHHSTLDTTGQILDFIHAQALAQPERCGVLFLGDFWHHRRNLRVDTLNTVLQHLQNWTVPLIMIPGNHDQITFSGMGPQSHALRPLQHAFQIHNTNTTTFPGPLILSYPTKFLNALFVPHVRDNAWMESILQSSMALQNDVQALFVHADVQGAYMNDQVVSTGGVPPRLFPLHKHIYSGHFHKPHVVEQSGRKIHYLGSPYQVSLAEAQQDKSLVVLDRRQNWSIVQQIPMNMFGRQHFRATTVEEFLQIRSVRSQDRVVFCTTTPVSSLPQPGQEHIQLLKSMGASVEIRDIALPHHPSPTEALPTTCPEDLSVLSTFTTFLEKERGRMTEKAFNELLAAGQSMIEESKDNEDATDDESITRMDFINLIFDQVSIQGFGPFESEVTYPLDQRGLVLVRGNNRDDGSDSNGSGKSTLATAVLWALTGDIDPRPVQDMKVGDIVNDRSTYAKVTLTGSFGGKEFIISRTKTAKKGGLVFILDGEDMSTQSVKETQENINETLGVTTSTLARTIFHGQHTLDGLLEASDTKIKEELALVVPLSNWQRLTQEARKIAREASKEVDRLLGKIDLRMSDKNALEIKYNSSLEAYEREMEVVSSRKEEILSQLSNLSEHQDHQPGSDLQEIQSKLGSFEELIKNLEQQKVQLKAEYGDKTTKRELASLAMKGKLENTLEQDLSRLRVRYENAMEEFRTIESDKQTLEKLWGIETVSLDLDSFVLPHTCPTCSQDISMHDTKGIREKTQAEIERVAKERKHILGVVEKLKHELALTEETIKEEEISIDRLNREVHDLKEEFFREESLLDQQIENARASLLEVMSALTRALQKVQVNSEKEILQRSLEDLVQKEKTAKNELHSLKESVEEIESVVMDLQMESENQTATASLYSELSNVFGQRGVQTFVMQNAVQSLKSRSQKFLDEFSEGTLRLELDLDTGEKISRHVSVMTPDGSFKARPLASLSGGQWRRCSLALNLGFADLVTARGKIRCNLCIFDEPLTHLDQSGRAGVGRVLRGFLQSNALGASTSLDLSTILVILQDLAAEELEEAFDRIDVVEKRNGKSIVLVDE